MSFFIDQQTFNDLSLLDKKGKESVFGIFNETHTRGGGEMLGQMFRYPLSNQQAIRKRSETISFFQKQNISFPFREDSFDIAEQYLRNADERSRLVVDDKKLGRMFNNLVGADTEYKEIIKGINTLIDLLDTFPVFLTQINNGNGSPYQQEAESIRTILQDEDLQIILNDPDRKHTGIEKKSAQDQVLRFEKKDILTKLLTLIYQLDVYMTVAGVATKRNFSFPTPTQSDNQVLKLEGIYHPMLEKPVTNELLVNENSNIIFLTGANMAGKSTFMKSMGIAVFLAHIGFPVPAKKMEFPVMEGLYTTINLPDNMGMGYSHFYAEVKRIKKVTQQLAQSKKLFVIFDELFRGTNVKDAYEATVALSTTFAQTSDCVFLISTHIIEAGEALKNTCDNVQFIYLPTRMQNQKPVYTYKLEEGITEDRHGMVIINNEKIIEILENPNKRNSDSPFVTDKQTTDDLNLQGKFKKNSVFSLFNKTKTAGGERLLEAMFRQPLSSLNEITDRSETFRYFQHRKMDFPFKKEELETTESYLLGGTVSNLFGAGTQAIRRQALSMLGLREDAELVNKGLKSAIVILQQLKSFVNQLLDDHPKNSFSDKLNEAKQIFESKKLNWMVGVDVKKSLSFIQVLMFDYHLHAQLQREMNSLMHLIYAIDVNITVSNVSATKNLTYAQAMPANENVLFIKDGFHPCLKNAVPNTIDMHADNNVIFLTGANMAGKSTFMKTFAISTYLAHMGFPVPAKSMSFSVKEGLYTSINVSDNLDMGYSHFYAEVLRVKNIAEEISSPKNLVVIFDELFKGTNVKDAYDGTLAISKELSKHSNCFFIISTHIVEVGEELKKDAKNISYTYMPTEMNGNVPTYHYRSKEGISDDRHGMMIIQNEKILDFNA